MKVRLEISVGREPAYTAEHAGPSLRLGRDPGCELAQLPLVAAWMF